MQTLGLTASYVTKIGLRVELYYSKLQYYSTIIYAYIHTHIYIIQLSKREILAYLSNQNQNITNTHIYTGLCTLAIRGG